MARTHYDSAEFWKMMRNAERIERELGCPEINMETRRNYTMRMWLYMAPVAGYC